LARRHAELLRSIPTLKEINLKTPAQFWKEVSAGPPPLDDAWFKEVAFMARQKRLEAVVAKLKERNPGCDVSEKNFIFGLGEPYSFSSPAKLNDIAPLRALPTLEHVVIRSDGRNLVSDLSPLKGMNLKSLDLYVTRVSDLSPLKGMEKLEVLKCWSMPVSDLSPLKGLPLRFLEIVDDDAVATASAEKACYPSQKTNFRNSSGSTKISGSI
jgi:hypothetical protein